MAVHVRQPDLSIYCLKIVIWLSLVMNFNELMCQIYTNFDISWYLTKPTFPSKLKNAFFHKFEKLCEIFKAFIRILDKMLRIFSKTCPLKMTITGRKHCQAKFVNQLFFPSFFLSYKEIIVQSWNFLHFASQSISEKNEHIILQENYRNKKIIRERRIEERSKMKWILNLKNNKKLTLFCKGDLFLRKEQKSLSKLTSKNLKSFYSQTMSVKPQLFRTFSVQISVPHQSRGKTALWNWFQSEILRISNSLMYVWVVIFVPFSETFACIIENDWMICNISAEWIYPQLRD